MFDHYHHHHHHYHHHHHHHHHHIHHHRHHHHYHPHHYHDHHHHHHHYHQYHCHHHQHIIINTPPFFHHIKNLAKRSFCHRHKTFLKELHLYLKRRDKTRSRNIFIILHPHNLKLFLIKFGHIQYACKLNFKRTFISQAEKQQITP